MSTPLAPATGWTGYTSAERLALITSVGYAVLFLVMWGPTWFGFGGWLFLYPVFLLAWIPVEAILVLSVILLMRERSRTERSGTLVSTRSGLLLGLGVSLAVLSLPLLWFGTSLLVPVL